MGMFGAGFAKKLGRVGDILAGNDAYGSQMQMEQQQALEAARIAAATAKASAPNYHFGPNGQVDKIDLATGQLSTVRAATAPVEGPTNTEQVYQFILKTQGKAVADQYLGNIAAGPPQMVTLPNGQMGFMPRSGPPPAGAQPSSGPPIGTVKNGYVFKGGNPKDQSAWEPVGGAGSGQPGFR